MSAPRNILVALLLLVAGSAGAQWNTGPVPNVITTAPITVGHTIINDGGVAYVDGGAPGGTGDVNGPASSVINNFASYSDITGKNLKDSGIAVGTSGATIPLLNGANTWSALQTFSTGILTATINVTNTITFGASGVNGSIALTTGSVAIGNAAVAPNFEDVSIGTFAGTLQNSSAGENTCVGYNCLARNVSSGHLTGMGSGALWHETGGGSTCIGSVCQRDYVSSGNNASIGSGTLFAGGGTFNFAGGINALQGNSSYVGITGACQASGTVALTFTGTYTGSPQTVTYTCVGTDTPATVVSGLSAAITANTTLTADSPGTPGMIATNDSPNLTLTFAGTQTTGVAITITSALSGAGSIALTIGGGATGSYNIALSDEAIWGHQLTTATDNFGGGEFTLHSLTTGSDNAAFLSHSLFSLLDGNANFCGGPFTCNLLQHGSGNLALVNGALENAVSTSAQVALGQFSMQNYVGTATGSSASAAVGEDSCKGSTGATFSQAVCVGAEAGQALSTGSGTYVGAAAGQFVTTGDNTLIGKSVGTVNVLTTGTGNIYIATDFSVNAAAATPASESHTLRIGGATNVITATSIHSSASSIGVFFPWVPSQTSYVNDTAAALGGVAIGQVYRNGSILQVRISANDNDPLHMAA